MSGVLREPRFYCFGHPASKAVPAHGEGRRTGVRLRASFFTKETGSKENSSGRSEASIRCNALRAAPPYRRLGRPCSSSYLHRAGREAVRLLLAVRRRPCRFGSGRQIALDSFRYTDFVSSLHGSTFRPDRGGPECPVWGIRVAFDLQFDGLTANPAEIRLFAAMRSAGASLRQRTNRTPFAPR